MPRSILLPSALLCLVAACTQPDDGEWIEPAVPAAGRTVNGVGMGEIPLAQLVPAVPAPDVEQGVCEVSHRQPSGFGIVQMRWPGGEGETRTATVMLDRAGQPMTYGEMRQTAAAMTSINVNMAEGTGGATNVTDGGATMTIGRGTADEALRSEALGVPARRMERILARCGRPGTKS